MYHVPHHARDFTYTTADLVSVLHLEHRTTVSMVGSGRVSGGLSSCMMVLTFKVSSEFLYVQAVSTSLGSSPALQHHLVSRC